MKSLNTIAIMNMLNEEQKLELLCVLEREVKREKSIADRIDQIMEKYFDLVWMARRDEELLNERPDIRKIFNEVSAKYPGELKKLQSHAGDWHHGFNSGMLACSRLLAAYAMPYDYKKKDENEKDAEVSDEYDSDDDDTVFTRDFNIQMAEDEFPMLDS
jgi:hypothetical protein